MTAFENNGEPWPPHDVVEKLVEAVHILLFRLDYDGHGHEEITQAYESATRWLDEESV